jgi:hypothetical protein
VRRARLARLSEGWVFPELPPGDPDRGLGEAGRHGQEEHRRGPLVPEVCGSEGEDEGRTPMASSAEPQPNTNANGGHAGEGTEGDSGLGERLVAALLPADQAAPLVGFKRRPVQAVGGELAQQVEVLANVLAEPTGPGYGDSAGDQTGSTARIMVCEWLPYGILRRTRATVVGCQGRRVWLGPARPGRGSAPCPPGGSRSGAVPPR